MGRAYHSPGPGKMILGGCGLCSSGTYPSTFGVVTIGGEGV